VLAYTGWIGLAVFLAWMAALGCSFWQIYRHTGQVFGLCLLVMALTHAMFDNYFETPYGAIPFYLLVGMALGSALSTAPAAPRAGDSEDNH